MTSALDRLSSALGLGSDAGAILGSLDQLYRAIDAEVAEQTAGQGLPCKMGCDACCHQSVFLSAPEFLRVAAELLATRSIEERRRVVSEMRALASRFSDELEQLEQFPPGAERDEVAARVAFRCPLLGSDGRCTIYPARELNARTFGATWDHRRAEPYGCPLTVARVLELGRSVAERWADPRDARMRLARAVPGTEKVQLYPWWFEQYGRYLTE